ncbi:MAG: response regulator [Spirochaetales bacterium]|nr:response regulator [Spirochaetales bacterium]
MAYNESKTIIIMADDDEDDRYMIREAFVKAGVNIPLFCVENGEELISLLESHQQQHGQMHPAFILLDLNMPRMDGRKSLEIIRKNENLKKIPVIVFTTSDSEEDVALAYEYGANSFILKPSSFTSMVDIMKTLKSYWLETVSLPE